MKVCILTLGCKVNEYESLSMATQLTNAGYSVTTTLNVADLYILNTCAVTNMAERKSRQMIAKITKLNPNAKIVVCGCASQHNNEQFTKFSNVFSVIGNVGKENILKYIENGYKGDIQDMPLEYVNMPYGAKSKTRQYIKIQDGCNNFCSYCIIPYTRGRSRSRDRLDIIDEIKSMNTSEVVVTGINVADYRENGKLALIDLLEDIDKLNIRFRLSSFECVIVDEEFLIRLSKLKNFCPFFHLSLQSGCNETLKRMNRHYTIEQFIEMCQRIKKYFPDSAISTDLIVGFKGETDAEFNTTMQNLKKIPFAFIHIFPYSVRQGTVAEKIKGDVEPIVIKEREKLLIEYNKTIKSNFILENIGEMRKVVVEEIIDGYSCGYAENYLYCYIESKCEVGTEVLVEIESKYLDGAKAKIVKK